MRVIFEILSHCIFLYLPYFVAASSVDFYTGISPSDLNRYIKGKLFSCIDGEKAIPPEYINDDYCDCLDGSDEPGTSACDKGRFYCRNEGFEELLISSSRVNDFVCDCCDGSDEYAGHITCQNTCLEMGRNAKENNERLNLIMEEGNKKRLQLIEESIRMKELKQSQIQELQQQIQLLEPIRNQLEEKKRVIEKEEEEAKEKHKQKFDGEKSRKKAEKENAKATQAFVNLDTNEDNKVSVDELMSHNDFDTDLDGTVTKDEALEWLKHETEVTLERFIDTVWSDMKDVYQSGQREEEEEGLPFYSIKLTVPVPFKPESDDFDEDDVKEDEEKDEEVDTEVPEYDEATKRLVEEADKIRDEFSDVDKKYRDAENQLRDAQSFLAKDFGPNMEFASLFAKCFEVSDLQYTYKLCPFEKASQRSKSGGVETTLGRWGKWFGQAGAEYSRQKYENGSSCWNGPERSTVVHFRCGVENNLIGCSEPSRCEYSCDFETPIACGQPAVSKESVQADKTLSQHDPSEL